MIHVVSLFSMLNDDFKAEEGDILIFPGLYGGYSSVMNFNGMGYIPIVIIRRYPEF